MKKIITAAVLAASFIASALPLTQSIASAKVGDVIGTAYNTDIVAYINNYAIPSYAVNGTSCIVAEDLRNFGCDVGWNDAVRSLYINRDPSITACTEMNVAKSGEAGSVFQDILETDIHVFLGSNRLTSYAINGYTMIPIEELTGLGECIWVPEQRAIKLWIDGLGIRGEMQPVMNSASKFDTLKNFVIAYGDHLETGNCILYESIEDYSDSLIYDVSKDQLSMVLSGKKTDTYIGLQIYRSKPPVLIINLHSDDIYYAGEFSSSTHRFTKTVSNISDASEASAQKLMNTALGLFDTILDSYGIGVSLYDFGIEY